MMSSAPLFEHFGDGVALAALAMSFWSLHKTNQFNKRQQDFAETADRLNNLLIEREADENADTKRANISANLFQASKNNYRLKVFNRGKGTARNVRIVDLDTSGDSLLMPSDIDHKFPVPILEQHQSVELIAAMHMASPSRAHVRLIWDDDAGKDQEKELTPSI